MQTFRTSRILNESTELFQISEPNLTLMEQFTCVLN
jgi:hypothetical protein